MIIIGGFAFFCISFAQFTVQSENSILHLFPQLNSNWENYLVIFRDINALENMNFNPTVGLNSRVISYDKRNMGTGLYRYSSTFNVVIIPLLVSDPNLPKSLMSTIFNFGNYLDVTTTIFVFLMPTTNPLPDSVITTVFGKLSIFPALKCIVTIDILSSSNCGTRPSYVKLLCNGYCENATYSVDSVNLLDIPFLSLHQTLFWNGNLKQIPSMVEDVFFYLNEDKRIQRLCLSRHKLFRSTCRADIMSFLLLGIVHNATFSMMKSTPGNFKMYQVTKMHTNEEHMVFSVIFNTYGLPHSFTQQLHFNAKESTSVIYCDSQKRSNGVHLQFNAWYEPLTLGGWLAFLFSLILTGILLRMDKIEAEIYKVILMLASIVFGQDGLGRKQYFLIGCGISFICMLYENSLLSLVTVALPPKTIESLAQLLDLNFKFIWEANVPTIWYRLEFDFNSSGRLDRLNSSFFFAQNATSIEDWVAIWTEKEENLALLQSSAVSEVALRDINKRIKLKDPYFACFMLKQTLAPKLQTWKINTENRYWILKTIGRIRQSGLFYEWDKWSTWRHLLAMKLFANSYYDAFKPDYINTEKLLPIYLICGFLLFTGLIILCFEFSYQFYCTI